MAHLLMIEGWISDSGNLILPLLKKLGHTYTFVTRNPALYKTLDRTKRHPLFQNAEDTIVVDTNHIQELIHAVKDCQFDGVVTVCDYYFEAVQEIANAYERPCPIPHQLQNVRQKHLMRQALDRFGIGNARFQLANSWQEAIDAATQIGYPLVVKPVDLSSSAFVRLVKNEEELKASFDVLKNFTLNFRNQERNTTILLEEFLDGDEVSVESVSFQGKTSIIGVTDKSVSGDPYFIETGHMFPAALQRDKYEELTQYVKEALDAVEFQNGVAHTEVKLTKEGPRIVEINPRVPGNYIVELIEHVTGINLLSIFVGLALGEEPPLLAKEIGIRSAAVMFLVPPKGGLIEGIHGAETLKRHPNLLRYDISDCIGRHIHNPSDNDCYLGHVIALDRNGLRARAYAQEAIKQVELVYAEE